MFCRLLIWSSLHIHISFLILSHEIHVPVRSIPMFLAVAFLLPTRDFLNEILQRPQSRLVSPCAKHSANIPEGIVSAAELMFWQSLKPRGNFSVHSAPHVCLSPSLAGMCPSFPRLNMLLVNGEPAEAAILSIQYFSSHVFNSLTDLFILKLIFKVISSKAQI